MRVIFQHFRQGIPWYRMLITFIKLPKHYKIFSEKEKFNFVFIFILFMEFVLVKNSFQMESKRTHILGPNF